MKTIYLINTTLRKLSSAFPCRGGGILLAITLAVMPSQLRAQVLDCWVAAGNDATSKYEVYDPSVTDWNSGGALKWSFGPTTAGGWTSTEVAAYSNPTEMKLRRSGSGLVVVSSASGGLATVATYPGGSMLWAQNVGGSYNPHSVELLPNGNVAVAASAGNFVRVYAASQGSRNGTYAQFNLNGAHSVLWDPNNNVLWALGTSVLLKLNVGGTAANPTLSQADSISLPATSGHDLSPFFGEPDKLWVTVSLNAYVYRKSTKTFTGAPGGANRSAVKGCGNQYSGEIVQCQQDNSECTLNTWCTPHVNFFTPEGTADYTRTRTGAAFYKCRIFTPDYLPSYYPAFVGPVQADFLGEMELFAVGTNTDVWHDWQTAPSSGWNPWENLGEGAYPGTVVARNLNGALEAFVVANDGNVWHAWESGPEGTWGGWYSLGGTGISNLVATCNDNGALQVFGIGANTDLWSIWQTSPGGGWSAWTDMGGAGIKPGFVVGKNGNGTLELFGVLTNGNVYHTWETSANSTTWASPWASLGGGGTNPRLAIGRNSDTRLQVFGIGSNGDIWTTWQNTPAGSWSTWTDMGVGAQPGFVVGQNRSGTMEICATTGGSPVHIWQTAPSNGWTTSWLPLGTTPPSNLDPQLVTGDNSDGRVQVFGKVTNGDVWTTWQNSPGGTWSNWSDMGASVKFYAGQ